MNLPQLQSEYYDYSGKASELSRKLALAGFAVIWAFKQDHGTIIPSGLVFPAFLLALALGADLLQYSSAAIVWGWVSMREERKLKDLKKDPEKLNFIPSRFINVLTDLFWGIKIILVLFAYLGMIKFFYALLS